MKCTCVGDTISGVEHNACCATRGIEGQNSLDGNIHGGHIEGLKHDLSHLLTISLRVEGSLCEQHRVLFWGDSQLVVEGVMPNLLHIIPVGYDAMLYGILQRQDASL